MTFTQHDRDFAGAFAAGSAVATLVYSSFLHAILAALVGYIIALLYNKAWERYGPRPTPPSAREDRAE